MVVRRVLYSDPLDRDSFSEKWFEVADEKRRRAIKNMTDYLLIDDFYSELKKRNLYLSKETSKEESDREGENTLTKLNEALLAAAENVLNKVDWNKYR